MSPELTISAPSPSIPAKPAIRGVDLSGFDTAVISRHGSVPNEARAPQISELAPFRVPLTSHESFTYNLIKGLATGISKHAAPMKAQDIATLKVGLEKFEGQILENLQIIGKDEQKFVLAFTTSSGELRQVAKTYGIKEEQAHELFHGIITVPYLYFVFEHIAPLIQDLGIKIIPSNRQDVGQNSATSIERTFNLLENCLIGGSESLAAILHWEAATPEEKRTAPRNKDKEELPVTKTDFPSSPTNESKFQQHAAIIQRFVLLDQRFHLGTFCHQKHANQERQYPKLYEALKNYLIEYLRKNNYQPKTSRIAQLCGVDEIDIQEFTDDAKLAIASYVALFKNRAINKAQFEGLMLRIRSRGIDNNIS